MPKIDLLAHAQPIPPAEDPKRAREYMTRRQAAHYIQDVLDRPFSFSTASKLAAQGEFASPAVWWGRRPLYTAAGLREWVKSRTRSTRPSDPGLGAGTLARRAGAAG